MEILDSGNRREYGTGAVRDVNETKGRMDLVPLDIAGIVMNDPVLIDINDYVRSGNRDYLVQVIRDFSDACYENIYTALIEVSKHYSDGCKKYGPRNWEKGLPLSCYIDSAVRHYVKFKRGDKDEPHDRAFLWNLFGVLWTQENKSDTELFDLPFCVE